MPHNSRIRALGFWVVGTLYPSELEAIDQLLFEAINGDQGGAWSPAAAIVIGGAGLQIQSSLKILSGAGLDIESGAVANILGGGKLEVEDSGVIEIKDSGALNLVSGAAATWASGSTAVFQTGAAIDMQGTMNVQSGATLSSAAGSTVTLAGTNTISGATTLSGATTQSAKLTKSGTGGRTAWRPHATLTTNTGGVISVDADVYHYTHTTTSNVTHYAAISALGTAPSSGERIRLRIVNTSTGTIELHNDAGARIVSFTFAAAGHARVEIYFDGTKWRHWMSWGESTVTIALGADA